MSTRIDLATERPSLVVATEGFLATFNDAGVLNPLDVKAAQTIARLLGETDDRVLLAAALAVRGTRYGHVCIRLDTVRDAVVVDGQDLEEIEQLPWPETEPWAEAVQSSPLLTNPDSPLIYEQGRLYLQRYHHYEQQVASLLLSRLPSPFGRGAEAYRQSRYAGEAGEGVLSESSGAPEAGQTLSVPPLAGGKYRRAEPGGRGAIERGRRGHRQHNRLPSPSESPPHARHPPARCRNRRNGQASSSNRRRSRHRQNPHHRRAPRRVGCC